MLLFYALYTFVCAVKKLARKMFSDQHWSRGGIALVEA